MAHFNFEVSLTDATRLDAPMERGPLMRWQRKALEAGVNRLAVPGRSNSLRTSGCRTPSNRTPDTPLNKTPGTGGSAPSHKTPNQKTGNKQQPNTPYQNLDRFIPNRSAMDLDVSHRLLQNSENVDPTTGEMSPRSAEYRRQLKEARGAGQGESKILAFCKKAPAVQEGHVSNLKVLYSAVKTKPTSQRHIPQRPDKVLDAPDLIDDYYLNPLSWSSMNLLTVAVGSCVFLWNPTNGDITQLVEMEGDDVYISSVSWIKEGNYLGVGVSDGTVQLWDVTAEKLLRTMTGHAARVASLSWNSYILSSGSRSGAIHHHDVRVGEHHVGTLRHHTQEVCGLSWSPDGRHLASGGNDNLVHIWDASLGHDGVNPLHCFSHHQAAVKAVAWCPWQSTLLATGGGTADRHIRFWNVNTGSCLSSTDTQSQVSALLWSPEYKEVISGHGYVQNQLTVWKYPSMTLQANLTSHTERILALASSPDGAYVASAAGDETIRLWKLFEHTKVKAKTTKTKTEDKLTMFTKSIR